MTRDEQRAACFEEMAAAMFDCYRGYNDETKKMMWLREKYGLILKAQRAFDALHGLAFVDPIKATDEMIAAGIKHRDNTQEGLGATFDVMAAAGDLTNKPEKKT